MTTAVLLLCMYGRKSPFHDHRVYAAVCATVCMPPCVCHRVFLSHTRTRILSVSVSLSLSATAIITSTYKGVLGQKPTKKMKFLNIEFVPIQLTNELRVHAGDGGCAGLKQVRLSDLRQGCCSRGR